MRPCQRPRTGVGGEEGHWARAPPQPPSPETARLVMRAGGALWHATHYISTISPHVLPSISSEALYIISMNINHLSATLPQSRGSCTRKHFYGCFCTWGRVAIRFYEQNRPSRLILVHDSPGGYRRRATAGRGGYKRAGSGGLGPSGPPPRHACYRPWRIRRQDPPMRGLQKEAKMRVSRRNLRGRLAKSKEIKNISKNQLH